MLLWVINGTLDCIAGRTDASRGPALGARRTRSASPCRRGIELPIEDAWTWFTLRSPLAVITRWALHPRLAAHRHQRPAITRADPWIIFARDERRAVERDDIESRISGFRVIGAAHGRCDPVAAVASGAGEANPVTFVRR